MWIVAPWRDRAEGIHSSTRTRGARRTADVMPTPTPRPRGRQRLPPITWTRGARPATHRWRDATPTPRPRGCQLLPDDHMTTALDLRRTRGVMHTPRPRGCQLLPDDHMTTALDLARQRGRDAHATPTWAPASAADPPITWTPATHRGRGRQRLPPIRRSHGPWTAVLVPATHRGRDAHGHATPHVGASFCRTVMVQGDRPARDRGRDAHAHATPTWVQAFAGRSHGLRRSSLRRTAGVMPTPTPRPRGYQLLPDDHDPRRSICEGTAGAMPRPTPRPRGRQCLPPITPTPRPRGRQTLPGDHMNCGARPATLA